MSLSLAIGNVLSPSENTTTTGNTATMVETIASQNTAMVPPLKNVAKDGALQTLQRSMMMMDSSSFSISVMQECSAIKKGLLWEQQQQRFLIFNRWKERFFILTADYLTCFKKGSKKVGMSEMGSFVYKINLNDIKNLNWVDKKKNGVIGIQLSNSMIFLWNNIDTVLDEWMSVLQDSTIRTKDRRTESLKKSATLLPNMMMINNNNHNNNHHHNHNNNHDNKNGSSTKHIKAEMIKRNDSPSLSHTTDDTTLLAVGNDDDDGSSVVDHHVVPPPPPPRRYLRCVSTDLGKMSAMNMEREIKVMTPTLSRNSIVAAAAASATTATISNSPRPAILAQNFTKIHLDKECSGKNFRKSTDVSSSHFVSQSLRCKSSYSMQLSPLIAANNGNHHHHHANINHHNNSPTIQFYQRRIAAKRSTALLHSMMEPPPPSLSSSTSNHRSSSSKSSFKSADSEFTFVNSRATTFKYGIDIGSIINGKKCSIDQDEDFSTSSGAAAPTTITSHQHRLSNFATNDRNASRCNNNKDNNYKNGNMNDNNNLGHLQRPRISSSASLMLNHQRRNKDRLMLETPPPVPPHRSHIHHF